MPADSEDRYFGGKRGSANKALAGMVKHYGLREGQRVFYALLADRRKAGRTYGPSKNRR